MTAELALELFDYVARPYLDQCFALNTGIEQSRILIEVLKRLAISAEPMACKLHVQVPARDFQFFASGDPVDFENATRLAKGFIRSRNSTDEVLGYHTVVLVERRIFVDLTLAQASSDQFDFRIKPCMIQFPLPVVVEEDELPDIRVDCVSDDDVPFDCRWLCVKDRDWEDTPAWEPSHLWPLIDIIEQSIWTEWLARRKAG